MTSHVPICAEILAERERQDAKWGEQNHPNGTGYATDIENATAARLMCERAFSTGYGTWKDILKEEVFEAFAESEPDALRAELIQVAAVATAWCEAIDRAVAKVAERG
jgi:hypothetical protein